MRSNDFDYTDIRQRIALNVRRIRTHLGLTQESVAFSAGLALRHYQKIEAAELNITLESLVRIAKALKVDISKLLSMEDH
jgi:transcriptional regulator with XRE-family HTH domain